MAEAAKKLALHAPRGVVGGLVIAVVVLAFTHGWHDGRTTLDGNGVLLYTDIGLHYWRSSGHLPYFVPDMWSGTPIWALAPILPVLLLLPLARVVGADAGVRYLTVLLQIWGGWGVMTLAASVWRDDRRTPWEPVTPIDPVAVAATVAGCLYALSPIVISHATFFGHETTIAVLAAAPWMVWSLRKGLRGDGTRWLALAALCATFAVLNQAEHAYALVIICLAVAIGQLSVVGSWRLIAKRSAAMVGAMVGLLAHWLIPLKELSSAFILSPPDVVSSSLTSGIGAQIGNEPGTFLHRSPGLANVVTYDHPDILRAGSFYLGWVWLLAAAVALVILALRPRRDRDATVCGLLLASVVCVWMSTAATPLARSGPGLRHEWLALAITGAAGGACAGVFIRRVATGRVVTGLAAGAVVLLFAAPYITPFLVLQHFIPLAGDLRLPRLYPLAPLGLSLAAAYPLSLIGQNAIRRPDIRVGQIGALIAAIGLLTLAIVDAWPYASFYKTRPPSDAAAYAAAAPHIPAGPVLTEQFGDPRVVDDLLKTGHSLITGWPHPIAVKGLWGLAVTPQEAAPPGYQATAAGLAGAMSSVAEVDTAPLVPVDPKDEPAFAKLMTNVHYPAPDVPVGAIGIQPIDGLPQVRAYDYAVVVDPSSTAGLNPTTELAVGLEPDHVSVVQGGQAAVKALGSVGIGSTPQPSTCISFGAEDGGPILGAHLATACALHRWVGQYVGLGASYFGKGLGAEFNAADGLAGVSLWVLGPTDGLRLQLRKAQPDGALGPPVLTATAGPPDVNGLTPFSFPAQPGGRYGFVVTCPTCKSNDMPSVVFANASAARASSTTGDMIAGNSLVTDLIVDFAPIYPLPPPAPQATATLTTLRHDPGNWAIEVSASRPQLVVLAQSYFPGWTAHVDGKKAPVLNADVAYVGVVVPAGTHRIAFRYKAPGVTAGDVITLLTLLGCLALWLPRRFVERGLSWARASERRIQDELRNASPGPPGMSGG